MAGKGRPPLGDRTYVRLDDELKDQLDAWAEARGMKRAEAIRHFIAAGLGISDAVDTLNLLGTQSVEALFPDAEGDAEQLHQLLQDGAAPVHSIELDDDLGWLELQVVRVRGRYVLVETRKADGAFTYAYGVFETAAPARRGFEDRLVEVTDELWDPDRGAAMWLEFESDLGLVAGLVKAGRVPAAAFAPDDGTTDWLTSAS